MERPKILCVVGPTACGKTRLGVLLAQQCGGEVVSVDSMQIYRGMEIGTAAPAASEQEGIPHHMVGIAEPDENWSAARFVEAADEAIQDILARGKRPVLVGGTGLYLDAIVAGRTFAPGRSGGAVRQALQQELAERGIGPLLEELQRVDPDSAAVIHPADTKRILRALEVYRETGSTISRHNQESRRQSDKYDATLFGVAFRDREDMRRQIDQRVEQMMEQGLLEEVQALAARNLPADATARQAIGYKELFPVLTGEKPLREAVEEIQLRSKQYAKRQLTWLRRNPNIHWILWEKERDFAAALQIVTEILSVEGLQ